MHNIKTGNISAFMERETPRLVERSLTVDGYQFIFYRGVVPGTFSILW